MKYIKIGMVLCAMLAFFPALLEAQTTVKLDIKAIVRSSEGEPIRGAVVRSEIDSTGAVTDSTGSFQLNVTNGATLSVDASGFMTINVEAKTDLTGITLMPNNNAHQVQVAFRKVNDNDLLGGVSAVNMDELMKKNYSTYGLSGMEALTNGFNGTLWGMDGTLILVDGIPRDINNVMPTEIDQISFLKGVAAVALYGSRAAKGVIYISTKRGKGIGQQINVRANSGMIVPKSYPKYLGSAEYMSLYNEALQNDGISKLYTDETIYNYASGKNPYRYPDVNYYSSDYLKKAYNRTDATAEIYGGGQRAHYYTNLGFATAGSLLNFGEAINNTRSNRFNMRGNIDIALNEYLSVKVDANAIFYTGRGVNADYWNGAATLRPNRFSPLIPLDMIEASDDASMKYVNTSNHIIDGKYLLGGTQLDQTNPFAAIYGGGHNSYNSRLFQFNTGFDANLKGILDGLTFHSMFAIDYSTIYTQAYNYNYAVYEPTWNSYAGTDQISAITKYNNDTNSGVENITGSGYSQTLAFTGQLNYLKTLNGKHNISAMVLANGYQQSQAGVYHNTANVNLGVQLGYNFSNKYYIDFTGAMVHSSKLPIANRNAFSPTLSVGWRVSKESFMAGISAIDNLKLTASAGILNTDRDISGSNLYQGIYTYTNAAWYSWRDGGLVHTFDQIQGGNPNLSFSKRKEINLGLEASLFKRLVTLNGSFFANRITDIVTQTSVLYPSYFTTGFPQYSNIPYINYNEDQRIGADFNLNLNKRIGKIDYLLGVSGTYYETKAVKRAESYQDHYQLRTGRALDAVWGLQNEGFFKDAADIQNSPTQTFGQVKPGDIKYKDQNGDGIIDSRDEKKLGTGGWYGAPFTLGINLTVKWKNLTFFALGVGRYGAIATKSNSYYWVYGTGKYSEVVRNRWTDATQNTATYPRLTTGSSDNNFRASDFWTYSANRFDISKVQISYQLSEKLLKKTFIHEMNVYVSGFDLWTIAPNRKALELNVGTAPQTRLFNVGVKAVF